ncbi:hypothetical protein Q8W71_10190 [Methylobacterium sp. NEAU 140]|nr:hypothetical protein [Methylobacterium sp. NEAU 140]MDP4022993.1 hypothetical protein [Methylobacterium sp. NEAU 140]
MATTMITKGMTAMDRVIATALTTGFAFALIECARVAALPTHFV